MEYQALYRKYRPQKFSEVIGQNHITETLANAIKNNSISHAYLFTGTRGTGKTSIAKIFARAISCETNSDGNPCNTCPTCLSLTTGGSLDIMEIDAASNNGVEYVRELRENVKYPPVNAKYKVYIIDEVHMLSESAFNALLKTLEEPPKFVVFILATTEVHKLPQTILSRCIRFDFKLVSTEALENHLDYVFKDSGIKCEPEARTLIARLGEGSVRDTLSIADMCSAFTNKNITYDAVLEASGATNKLALNEIAKKILSGDINNLLEIVENLATSGKNIAQLNRDLLEYFKDLTIIKTCANAKSLLNYPADTFLQMEEVASLTTNSKLISILQKLSGLEQEFRYTNNPKSLFEISLLGLYKNEEDLLKRIADLENKLKSVQPWRC